jgi:hypothetical protein
MVTLLLGVALLPGAVAAIVAIGLGVVLRLILAVAAGLEAAGRT